MRSYKTQDLEKIQLQDYAKRRESETLEKCRTKEFPRQKRSVAIISSACCWILSRMLLGHVQKCECSAVSAQIKTYREVMHWELFKMSKVLQH